MRREKEDWSFKVSAEGHSNAIPDPLAFLAQVMRGKPIETMPAADGNQPTLVTPTLDQRIVVARVLAHKLLPNAKDPPVKLVLPDVDSARRCAGCAKRDHFRDGPW